jgi:hypothetical protein
VQLRGGSIPVVLLIVVVLGILATTVIYMTGSHARLEKAVEINDIAHRLAVAAIEETLVKVSNNSAIWGADGTSHAETTNVTDTGGTKKYFAPYATRLWAVRMVPGAEVPPVAMSARLIEQPANPAARTEFEELVTAAPAFAGTKHVDDWHKDTKWTGDKEFMKEEAVKSLIRHPEGHGEEYHQQEFIGNYKNRAADSIKEAFNAVPELPALAWHTVDNDQDSSGNRHSDAQLSAWNDKWTAAMSAIADHVRSRIDGCGGNPNYGVGAEIAAFALGMKADNDSQAEEKFRESAQAGGVLNYTASLVTLQSTIWLTRGPVKVEKQAVAHRIVQTINLKPSMDKLRNSMIPYLIYHYNLTPRDLLSLRFATLGFTDKDGNTSKKVQQMESVDTMFTELKARFPDNPNPKVWPFQVATCHTKAKP